MATGMAIVIGASTAVPLGLATAQAPVQAAPAPLVQRVEANRVASATCATLAEANRIAFLSNRDFLNERNSPNRCQDFDWSTDGCSVPAWVQATVFLMPGGPVLFYWMRKNMHRFVDACTQHDFAYQAFGPQGRALDTSAEQRLKVDNHWRSIMRSRCDGIGRVKERQCKRAADTFYAAVRTKPW